ncbi:glycosyltransferase [Alteromonas sp. ASW11-19]|uniref:Glycosyltransferase n=1 Tax=Alteromonas salexigens TaxID=2982530 RepID=A0ABT2VPR1_9ALTE|nr:glycosyltransferase [Alteromonas salexigens]MCU7554443.1 glycosyltransferase [Alteromonas salexigens]
MENLMLSKKFDIIIKSWKDGRLDKARYELDALLIGQKLPASIKLKKFISEKLFKDDPACFPMSSNGIDWPKISVVTPSFNQGKYIEETIVSVISQAYPNIEFIIIDGGSTDSTVSVIEKYSEHINYFVSEPDKGQSDAINKGFDKATGDIYTWLNSDDQFAPNALFKMALAFITSKADLVAGICEVYENDKIISRHITACEEGVLPIQELLDLDKGWNAGQFFYQPEVFFTKDLWERAGAHVKTDCFYSMDYEMWCRFAAVKANLHIIHTPIVNFRSHPEQKTADPTKFKQELLSVRKRFIEEWDIEPEELNRPEFEWGRKLRVLAINDHGFNYGAGIAHQRICAALEMAGHQVTPLDLSVSKGSHSAYVNAAIEKNNPDIVIFGNIHSQIPDTVALIDEIQKKLPTYWVVHDFWLFTGRCAYPGFCQKHLTGCDAECPSKNEYPIIDEYKINAAWEEKVSLLKNSTNLKLFVNSAWTRSFVASKLEALGASVPVYDIQLGVPSYLYKPVDKSHCREEFGVGSDEFVLGFSVSSLSDPRKGGKLFLDAVRRLDINKLVILLIGNLDVSIKLDNCRIISTGYVKEQKTVVSALNAMDLFVAPSSEETLGQVYLEAAMCGVPSIGLNMSGIKDAIIDGVTGYKLNNSSSEELSKIISTLYRDETMRRSLSKSSHLYAHNKFTLEACYHSIHAALLQEKIFDKVGAPRKIELSHDVKSIRDKPVILSYKKGVDVEEGPYPESGIDYKFRWCHSSKSVIGVSISKEVEKLSLRIKNVLFSEQVISIRFIDEELVVSLSRSEEKVVDLYIANMKSNYFEVTLIPSKFHKSSLNEKRELSFKLLSIEDV